VKEVRGAGLIWGLELTRDAAPVVPAALARGVIVNRTAENVVRLLPPLVITVEEVDEGLARLDAALGSVEAEGGAA
jgi:acetylornithine/succinyldiaminopimelate/putrescine aminotransferase